MRIAVFTIVHNEKIFFPLWLKHYSQWFGPDDIYVVDHETTDNSLNLSGFQTIKIYNKETFNHSWLLEQVKKIQTELLQKYDWVIFTEVDELIYHATQPLQEFVASLKEEGACKGYEPIHNPDTEPALNWEQPILKQRKFGRPNNMYNKTLMANKPTDWSLGFHSVYNASRELLPNLFLIHLRYIDYQSAFKRLWERLDLPFCEYDLKNQLGVQNAGQEEADFRNKWPITAEVIPSEVLEGNHGI